MSEPIEYRDHAEWLRTKAKNDPYNPSNFAMLEAADKIDRLHAQLHYYIEALDGWSRLADDLYTQLMRKFCWHCGHETTRNIDADHVAEMYRQRVVDLRKKHEQTTR